MLKRIWDRIFGRRPRRPTNHETRLLQAMQQAVDVERGSLAPGSVIKVTKHADGRVTREEIDPLEYQAERKRINQTPRVHEPEKGTAAD